MKKTLLLIFCLAIRIWWTNSDGVTRSGLIFGTEEKGLVIVARQDNGTVTRVPARSIKRLRHEAGKGIDL